MKKIVLVIGVVSTVFATSCRRNGFCEKAKGEIKVEERSVELFSKIESEEAFNVFITQNKDLKEGVVIVEAPEDVMDDIRTQVNGNVLVIDNKKCIRTDDAITIYVKSDEINGISLSGSGNIETQNTLTTKSMNIDLSGSGNIDADLDVESYRTEIQGSGNISSFGETISQNLKISGSGNIRNYGLTSEKANVKITGSGDIEVYTSEKLDVNISGSGNVSYKGNASVASKVEGSGGVRNDN